MPLAGEQLTYKQALALCRAVGFPLGKTLDTAVAVMCAESGRYTEAWHDNLDADGNVLSTDRGLFQINSLHVAITGAMAYNPKCNAEYTFQLSKHGTDWTPWAAYNNGAHRKFIPIVKAIRLLGRWKTRIPIYLSMPGCEERP